MCGIAGYIGGRPLSGQRIKLALSSMDHRGPDHAASKSWELPGGRYLSLLHARLSIIDLDPRSNQPFGIREDDTEHWIAYNGELYNYLEVRQSLATRGVSCQTLSDTEVLLRALATHGPPAMQNLEGMWAFAWFDRKSNQLTLSRDRFGEKPLYLWRDGNGDLYFASEVKTLEALADRKFEPDYNHLKRYLVNGYKSLHKTSQTFHRDVTQLTPGTYISLDLSGKGDAVQYWKAVFEPDESITFRDAIEGARQELVRSVDIRMRSDVSLAFCMSSGVDSNALISIARRELGREVHGFTVVNSDPRYDEAALTRQAARELDVQLTEVPVEKTDFLARLQELVKVHDGPVYTISYYVHWLLMKAMADAGYKISISGTAADEIFSGYFDHHLLYLAQISDDAELYGDAQGAWKKHVAPVVRNPFLQDPEAFIKNPAQRGHIFLDASAFSEFLVDGWMEDFAEEPYSYDLLRGRMLNELFHESVPQILHEDDLNAMSVSIENRSPFLDSGLLDFMMKVPTRHLFRDGYAKAILREAIRGIAPDQVVDNRRKVGFNAPVLDMLDLNAPDIKDWMMSESPVFDMIKREKIEEFLDVKYVENSKSKFLFYFLNVKIFLENKIK